MSVALGVAVAACSGRIASPGGGNTGPDGPGGSGPRSGGTPGAGAQAGRSTGGGGSGGAAGPTDAVVVKGAATRRLTSTQITNVLSDVFGYSDTRPNAQPTVPRKAAFVDANYLQSYLMFAEHTADALVAQGGGLASCAAGSAGQACVGKEVATLGERLFRRPLTDEEKTRYSKLFASGAEGADAKEGAATVFTAMLTSPQFVYRLEGPHQAGDALTPSELASRLSFALWDSGPDDELLAAARGGSLALDAQVARMMGSPKARRMTTGFFASFVPFEQAKNATRDVKLFPDAKPELLTDFVAETRAFLEGVFWDDGGTVKDLFTSTDSYLSPRLATFYGAAAPSGTANAAGLVRTKLPSQRAGLLTQASLLTALAHPDEGAPVLRGVFVMRKLMCETLPQPPPDVKLPDPPSPTASQRDRYAQHSVGSCASCHKSIDPIGFGFETYDALGRYIPKENGFAVSGQGKIASLDGKEVTFTGAVELGRLLGDSAQVRRCVVRNLFQYMTDIDDVDTADAAVGTIDAGFQSGGGKLKNLPAAVIQSSVFALPRIGG